MSYAVLICDDDPSTRSAIRASLDGFEVVEADSAKAARDALELRPFDAIVASPIDVLVFARMAYPRTIRFLVTSEAIEAVVREVNMGAAHRFFEKPCDAQRVRGALDAELSARAARP